MAEDEKKVKKQHPGMQNLKPPITSERARELGRLGAIKSAEVRRQKKNLRELAQAMLQTAVVDKAAAAELKALGLDASNGAMLLAAMLQKAVKGSERAAEFVRDTSGQAPDKTVSIALSASTPEEMRSLSDDDLVRIAAEDATAALPAATAPAAELLDSTEIIAAGLPDIQPAKAE